MIDYGISHAANEIVVVSLVDLVGEGKDVAVWEGYACEGWCRACGVDERAEWFG